MNNLHPLTTGPPFSSSERNGGLHFHKTPRGPNSPNTVPTSPPLLGNSSSTSADPPLFATNRSQQTPNPPHTVHHKVATSHHSTPPKLVVSRVTTTIPKNERHVRSWRTTTPSTLAPSTTPSHISPHLLRKNTPTPTSSKSTSTNSTPMHEAT